jgi:glycosyltransferase involved in cell wall biosynthesis
MGLGARVHFTGMRSDVPVALAAMDVFVLSSKFEPFGVSLLEAMAAGKAIVSTSVNETAEILEDGRCGVLVPPEDSAAMADALRRVLSDQGMRQSLAHAARARAERCYGVTAMTRAYEALYSELAGLPHDATGARGGG